MKTLIVFGLAAIATVNTYQATTYTDDCYVQDLKDTYRRSLYDFSLLLYKKMAERGDYNFVFSPFLVWWNLAVLAEGADPNIQQNLFQYLRLPSNPCVRQKYYDIMKGRINNGHDLQLEMTPSLLISDSLLLNPNWLSLASRNSKLGVATTPKWSFPLRDLGNSAILDTVEYNGLWTTAFEDFKIKRAPYYSQSGDRIGSVDLMTLKKRVKMSYVPEMDMKIMELPIGGDSRYRMIFGLILTRTDDLKPILDELTTERVVKMLDDLRDTNGPIDIAIPKMRITSDIDIKGVLQDVGFTSLFDDPTATKYISTPPAQPRSYSQRATLTLNTGGVYYSYQPLDGLYSGSQTPDGLYSVPRNATAFPAGHFTDFIADRPLLFAVVDAETYSCVVSSMYSKPTYA